MRRSAAVLERLAEKLPYSAVALCRLMRPVNLKTVSATSWQSAGGPRMLHHTSSASTVPVDASGHSVDSSSQRATAVPPPLPSRSDRRDSLDPKPEQAGVSSCGAAASSPPPPPPPPPPEAGARRGSSSSSVAEVTAETAAAAAAAAASAPRLVESQTEEAVGEVAVEEWGATGRDDGVDEEVVW